MLNNSYLQNPVALAHLLISSRTVAGGVAIDATAGNGRDTLFLASLIGAGGKVYAFDIQERALAKTRELLIEANAFNQVHLILAGHETLAQHVTEKADIIMFNLGYLPGGDHGVVTSLESTLSAIEQSLTILKPQGILSVIIYSGHPGGWEEGQAVEELLTQLPKEQFQVLKFSYLNRSKTAPSLVLVEKSLNRRRG